MRACVIMAVCVLCAAVQAEVSSSAEAVANAVQFPVEVTGGHMRPVVVLEKLDLTW